MNKENVEAVDEGEVTEPVVEVKRGRGRPKGSKNKPKVDEETVETQENK